MRNLEAVLGKVGQTLVRSSQEQHKEFSRRLINRAGRGAHHTQWSYEERT